MTLDLLVTRLPFEFHILDRQFIEGAVTRAHQNIAVGQLGERSHPLAEQFVVGSETFKEGAFDRNLQHVSGSGAAIGVLVVDVDDGASEHTFDVAEVHVQTFDLFREVLFCWPCRP